MWTTGCVNPALFRPNGVLFIAAPGTSEFSKRWTPTTGDVVSFKHHGFLLASKKPKLPTLTRLRPDLSWSDVLANWKEKIHVPTGILTTVFPNSTGFTYNC